LQTITNTQIQYIKVQQIVVVTFEFSGAARGYMIMSCAARRVKKVGQHWPRPIHAPFRPNYTPMISITISILLKDILKNYLIFQQVRPTEDSVLSGKLSEKAKITELKS